MYNFRSIATYIYTHVPTILSHKSDFLACSAHRIAPSPIYALCSTLRDVPSRLSSICLSGKLHYPSHSHHCLNGNMVCLSICVRCYMIINGDCSVKWKMNMKNESKISFHRYKIHHRHVTYSLYTRDLVRDF